jgi:hypothetical protein
MQEVAKVWRPGVSKVHYRMNLIDATGTQLGTAIPQFPPKDDPERLRGTYLRTMAYTTPPGSGNAYSRDFVRNVFALGPTIPESDATLLTLAPILGDVLTIRKPLARYSRIARATVGCDRSTHSNSESSCTRILRERAYSRAYLASSEF